MNLRLLATPLAAATLLLSTLGCAKKEEAPAPPIALQGTWTHDNLVKLYYDANMKLLTQQDSPGAGLRNILTDSLIQRLYSPNYLPTSAPFPYKHDGDSLRITWPGFPTQAFGILKHTATELTLRSRRYSIIPAIKLSNGEIIYYCRDELQWTRY